MTEHIAPPPGAEGFARTERFQPRDRSDAPKKPPLINPSPFIWIDPTEIPRRRWLYGFHMIRSFTSATFAPGETGKSRLLVTEALAIATGRSLLGIEPAEQANVWVWNGEDPLDELRRCVTAAMLHHSISPTDIDGKLFLDSGREQEIVIAGMNRGGTVIAKPLEEHLIAMIREREIGLMIVDPFVSSHQVSENDNNAIDAVAKTWARIANATDCAIELVHHVRKTNGAEVSVEDARGASALLSAVRSARTLNKMSVEEAERANIENRRLFFKVENGKANLTVPPDKSDWYRIASVNLGNGVDEAPGDSVGVVTRWEWPSAFDGVSLDDLPAIQKRIAAGEWRADMRSNQWAGLAIAEVLDLNLSDPAVKTQIKSLIAAWIKAGALKVVPRFDEHRHRKEFIEVGEWAA